MLVIAARSTLWKYPLGTVGPDAFAEDTQDYIHDIIRDRG